VPTLHQHALDVEMRARGREIGRITLAVGVHMKAVETWRQPTCVHRQRDTVGSVREANLADLVAARGSQDGHRRGCRVLSAGRTHLQCYQSDRTYSEQTDNGVP
jgi:hypothetical protein